jgi:phasin family protein
MYPFSEAVTPAAQHHIQAQMALLNDMSRSLMQSAQQFSELQLQFTQSVIEDCSNVGGALAGIGKPTELFSIAADNARPGAMRLRAYQQQLSRIMADGQASLIKVASDHAAETTRAAREFTDEVTRLTSEETERTVRSQQDTMRQVVKPLDGLVDSAARYARAAMGDGQDFAAQTATAAAAAAATAARPAARKEQQAPEQHH